MSKDVVIQCINKASKIIEVVLSCNDCVELFVDYNPLRYPYASFFVMLIKCDRDNEYLENCSDMYNVIIEATLTIDSVFKEVLDLHEDFTNIKVKCGDGWFEYGYTVQRTTQSVGYAFKGFTVVYGGRRYTVESIDQVFMNKLCTGLTSLVKKVREIMDQEGIA